MAIISYAARMRERYPALAHLWPEQPAPLATRGRGKRQATHRMIAHERDGNVVGHSAYCGTTAHYLHYAAQENEITCAKCLAGHFGRR